ncbi:DUF480 domain-containing protein [Acidobacteria bacterium ACD]|nr:MAG: DUF480 domain-containing protein [Acidobacteriota bacterium]MDL1951876.1 DUF480 domain-containing protein [Acidobacteria bacterium ACD]
MRPARDLDLVEARVLGSLLEKEQTTPEYYPLTLNALVAACNQRNNREPVTDLSEDDVETALSRLRELGLAWKVPGGRAVKYSHAVDTRIPLPPGGKAILTLLLLRGPQTPGELRGRSDRLHPFPTLEAVESVLADLAGGSAPLAVELPRRTGQKETRWAQLLTGPPGEDLAAPAPAAVEGASPALAGSIAARVEALERESASLRAELAALQDQLAELKRSLGE